MCGGGGTSLSVGVLSFRGESAPGWGHGRDRNMEQRPAPMSFRLWVPLGLCIWTWQFQEPLDPLYGLSFIELDFLPLLASKEF